MKGKIRRGIIFVFLAIAVFVLLWDIVSPKKETILYIGFYDEELQTEEKAKLETELDVVLQTEKKQEIVLDDNLYTSNNAVRKIEVLVFNHKLDLLVAEREVFEAYAASGFFEDLSTVEGLTEIAAEERFVSCAGYLEDEEEEITFEDHSTGQGEVRPYGISLKNTVWEDLFQYMEDPVVGLILERSHEEASLRALEVLVQEG